jgi:hypothetical protein
MNRRGKRRAGGLSTAGPPIRHHHRNEGYDTMTRKLLIAILFALTIATGAIAPAQGCMSLTGAGRCRPPAGSPSITFISNTATCVGGSSGGTTSDVDTTGANFLVLNVGFLSSAAPITVSDSKGNTWSSLTAQSTGTNASVQVFYAANATVGTGHNFTISAIGSFSTACVAAFSNVKTSSPLDQQSGAGNASASTIQAGSVAPTENNELIITSVVSHLAGEPFTIDSSFAIAAQQDDISSCCFPSGLAYIIQTSAGAANPTWTLTGSAGQTAAQIATFKKQP